MKITASSYRRMPDSIWLRLCKLLPKPKPHPKGGRPPLELRRVADGVYYVMRTACPWKAAPREYGSGSSLHRYFQQWVERGVFRKLWKQGLVEYDARRGIVWRWQTLDTATTKAPLGGEKNREKSYRSRQAGSEAIGAHRRSRRRAGADHHRGQPVGSRIGPADARGGARSSSPAGPVAATAPVRRQDVCREGVSPQARTASLHGAYPLAGRRRRRTSSPSACQAASLGE